MKTTRITLQLWRADLFILLLLTTQSFSRPVQLTEERVDKRDTAKQGRGGGLVNTKNDGKLDKDESKEEKKGLHNTSYLAA